MSVPGNALQVAAAREAALGRLGEGGALAATLWRWALRVGVVAAIALVIAVLLRAPIASIVNVDESFAAAMVVPTAFLWLIICLQRVPRHRHDEERGQQRAQRAVVRGAQDPGEDDGEDEGDAIGDQLRRGHARRAHGVGLLERLPARAHDRLGRPQRLQLGRRQRGVHR